MSDTTSSKVKIQIRHMGGKKWSGIIPASVRDVIRKHAGEYGKSFTLRFESEGKKFYGYEGVRISVIRGDEVRSVEMVAEHNIGASGVHHGIGSSFEPKAGAWVIESRLFLGQMFVDVTHINEGS